MTDPGGTLGGVDAPRDPYPDVVGCLDINGMSTVAFDGL